jgi:hypothetical protein
VARANLAAAEISENNNLVFEGVLFSRGAVAEVRRGLGGRREAGGSGLGLGCFISNCYPRVLSTVHICLMLVFVA